jgi:type IV pilus assembly protein PilA
MRHLASRIAQPDGEGGFTLMELLIIVAILGVLLGIAVPSYLGLTGKAEHAVAEANVREAIPSIEAFYSDNGTYVGLENPPTAAVPGLKHYDPASAAKVAVAVSTQSSYCVYSTNGGTTYFKKGPGGDITHDPGPVVDDCDTST